MPNRVLNAIEYSVVGKSSEPGSSSGNAEGKDSIQYATIVIVILLKFVYLAISCNTDFHTVPVTAVSL